MRLLYLCSDFGIAPGGTKGASVHLREITRALAELGHEVLLLSPRGRKDERHCVKLVSAGTDTAADKTTKVLKRWLVERGLGDSAAKELRALLYNALAREPALQELAQHPPDAIVERLSLFGHVGIDLAEALSVPLVLEVNAPLAEEAGEYRSLQLRDLAGDIERRVLDRAAAVVCVSEPLVDRLASADADRQKYTVIPNGVDMELFDAAPPRDVCRKNLALGDEFTVGFIGSLKPWHGVDVLLGAFKRLIGEVDSARLLIVGSGPEEERLRGEATDLKLGESVTFVGPVAHEAVPQLLKAMDVAVAPFKNADGFYFSPIKLFEYMASSVCVAASRLGQIADVIQDDVNGFLVPPGDVDALHGVLRTAWLSPERRCRLGSGGQETVRSRYTWRHTAKALTRVIEGALRQGRSGSKILLAQSH
ncbi:MAG: glycosyltransferase family 4 protein [Phycisphaerae bacterium]